MTFVAVCMAAMLCTGAALAGGPQRSVDERDTATTARTPAKVQMQLRSQPVAIARSTGSAAVQTQTDNSGGVAGACGPGAGDCCEANDTPGCENISCCNAVCDADEFCCFFSWTQSCVDLAVNLCAECEIVIECGSDGTGNCCVDNGTPYCDNEECCEQICAVDAFCCDTHWDQSCADAAADLDTGCEICQIPPHPACGPPNENNCCLTNTTGGCADADCCNNVCFCDPFCCNTAWDNFCAGTGLDDDCLCGPGTCGALNTPACAGLCDPTGDCGDELAISCCAADIVALQGPACNDAPCCNAVCAADPLCCGTAWDYACAVQANALCGCDGFFSNTSNFLSSGFAPGGAGAPGGTVQADLLQMVEAGDVREITFSVANFAPNTTLLTLDLELLFMPVEVDGDGFVVAPNLAGPNVITIPVDGTVNLAANTVGLFFVEDNDGFFNTADLNDEFPLAMWAGIRMVAATFSGTGSLANVGQGLFNPPTVGFSSDMAFLEGFGLHGFTGAPANYGWEILGETVSFACGDPDAGSCFEANGTPACSDADCCNTVCACDPFCCATEWDELCAGEGLPGSGCGAALLCDAPSTGACTISNCPADLTGDNSVGVADLLALLAAWGPNPGHPADLTGDGSVGVADLLALLAAWGPCPAASCQVLSSGDCAAAGGTYQGDGSSCP